MAKRGIKTPVRPQGFGSNARMFAQRGNPMYSERELDKEFPLRQSRPADDNSEPTVLDIALAKIRDELKRQQGLSTLDFKKGLPAIDVNADLDAFTKAHRAPIREPYVDPKPQPPSPESNLQRRLAAVAARMHKNMNAKTIDASPKNVRPQKVKGSFYRFADVGQQIPDTPAPAPRPLFGKPVQWAKKENDGHKHVYVDFHGGHKRCRLCGTNKEG